MKELRPFSKETTNITKGILIILMLIHHLFSDDVIENMGLIPLCDDVLFYNSNYIWSKSEWVNYPSISEFLTSKAPGFGYTMFTAAFVLCMALLLVINHPEFKSDNRILTMKEEPWLLTARSIVYAVPLMLSVAIKILK